MPTPGAAAEAPPPQTSAPLESAPGAVPTPRADAEAPGAEAAPPRSSAPLASAPGAAPTPRAGEDAAGAGAEARRVPPPAADPPPIAAPVARIGLPIATRRTSLSDAEFPFGGSWDYIGRGSVIHGLGRSPWANPFIIGAHGGRHEVIKRFASYLDDSPHLLAGMSALSGCVLVCHCALRERCHGDSIIAAFLRDFQGVDNLDGETSSSDEAGNQKARRWLAWRRTAHTCRAGARWRDTKEGGGLCSPGRWLPERRRLPPAGADLGCRLARLADDHGIGRERVRRLLAQLASGHLERPVRGIDSGSSRSRSAGSALGPGPPCCCRGL